jgi:branched-chain amino acid transport system permease protein
MNGALARTRTGWPAVGMGLAVLFLLAVLPIALRSTYFQHLCVVTFLYLVLMASYNLAVGYTGYLSLSHATFFGIGGYASAIATVRYGMPAVAGALVALVVTGAGSLLLGWIAFKRVRGFAFSIVTLGFAITTYIAVTNWSDFTGGPTGIPGIPRPTVPLPGRSMTVVHTSEFYYLGLAFAAFVLGFVQWIRTSRVGRALLAIRENEHLASALGVNALIYKLFAFVVGSTLAGAAGSFYAHYLTVVTPEILWILWITALLAMLIVGGPGSLIGVSLATVALVLMPEILRVFEVYRELLYGVLLLAVIRFMPQGIGGVIEGAIYRRRLARWRSSQ